MTLISALQAVKYLNIEAKTLANSRSSGVGVCIPFVKVGGKINYKQEDLDAYIEANTYKHNHAKRGVKNV